MKQLFRLLNSAGIDPQEYSRIEPELNKTNLIHVSYYSVAGFLLFLLLAAANLITGFYFAANTALYSVTALLMLVISVIAWQLKKHEQASELAVDILCYGFMSILYIASTILSLLHPDMSAVSYIGVLIVLPLLFADRPVNIAMHQLMFVILFCILVNLYKDKFIALDDTWNVVSFYVVSLMATVIVMPVRVRNVLNLKKLAFLSSHDLLTGVKNRNAYELFISESKTSDDFCVYADVNGLHELNDSCGHAAGDEMLKTVAQSMKEVFGEENTFRLGGDEFAAFYTGCDEFELREKLREIRQNCEKKNYYISIGYAGPADSCGCNEKLVSLAEKRMYIAKDEFYSEHAEFERRG